MRQIVLWSIAPLALLMTFSTKYAIAQFPNRETIVLAQRNNWEQAVIGEINRVRANPAAYAAELERLRRYFDGNLLRIPGKIPVRTQEGVAVVDEAIQFLRSTPPAPPLSLSSGISQAARDHVNDQGPKGSIGHGGSDGSDPFSRMRRYGSAQGLQAENVSYGPDSPQDAVMQLIIDDGVPNRGHRESVVNPNFRVAGVACGSHARFRSMCVIDYAAAFTERDGTVTGQNSNIDNSNTRPPRQNRNPSVSIDRPRPRVADNYCGSGIVSEPTIRTDSHDSSPYKVWFDFRRGQEVSSSVCGRQYWVKEDGNHYNYSIPFVYLVDGRGTCVVPYLYRETNDGDLEVVRPAPECSGGYQRSNATPRIQPPSNNQPSRDNPSERLW
ncbi:CAP domain-containing protein [Argonema antarcticum]|uniref:CAP domain-containing protein n=1 Tax=Argonema antarcticum TaxID=2942763 RepID=UPI002010F70D|nr:CAP domain-containing protein [Argonema antarcticum]MCL1471951.1 CAP domain-containing protein [Argonema antarcticum A004/B2]